MTKTAAPEWIIGPIIAAAIAGTGWLIDHFVHLVDDNPALVYDTQYLGGKETKVFKLSLSNLSKTKKLDDIVVYLFPKSDDTKFYWESPAQDKTERPEDCVPEKNAEVDTRSPTWFDGQEPCVSPSYAKYELMTVQPDAKYDLFIKYRGVDAVIPYITSKKSSIRIAKKDDFEIKLAQNEDSVLISLWIIGIVSTTWLILCTLRRTAS